ncbi:MAG TPA: hypothetical protein VMV90_04510 [Rectinemataceae bacterium]|nr:hypothetical protein [Rectinemataceae bacterium]
MSGIVTSPERIHVGYVPPCERWRFSPACAASGGRGRRARIDRAGPALLFLLLCSSFVPSLLTEFDLSQLLRTLQAIVLALGQPSPVFVSGRPRSPGAPAECIFSGSGPHAADSDAIAFDGRPVGPEASIRLGRRLSQASRRRRSRSKSSPRAPPGPTVL